MTSCLGDPREDGSLQEVMKFEVVLKSQAQWWGWRF